MNQSLIRPWLDKEWIIEYYINKRMSWYEIANMAGCSEAALRHIAKKFDIKSRSTSEANLHKHQLDMNEIRILYQTMSINEICAKFNMNYSTMRSYMIKAGIRLRSMSHAKSKSYDINATPKKYWDYKSWLTTAYATSSIYQISDYVGWSYGAVRKAILAHNIKLLSNREAALRQFSINSCLPPLKPPNIDRELLKSMVDDRKTLIEISNHFEISVTALSEILLELSIPHPTNTIKSYIPNKAKMSLASKKKWQSSEFRNKVIQSLKSKWSNDQDLKNRAAIVRSQTNRLSGPQLALYNILDSFKIQFDKEGPNTVFGPYTFDCLIKNYYKNRHLLIEVQGDYWHSLSKTKGNDRAKFKIIQEYFPEHELMYIWEHEFNNIDKLINKLSSKLHVDNNIIDFKFNDILLREIEYHDAKHLLDAYHYLGGSRSGKAIGGFINDELIIVILFCSPIRQNIFSQFNMQNNKNIIEIARLCVHPQFQKNNLCSWFISKAIKYIDCELIVAYADTTVGHKGTVYKASNFKFHHTVPVDYWYLLGSKIMHKKTLYNKAKTVGLTESEFAQKFGYARIYGGEKLCYVYDLRE